jgi:hypothetical protein
MEKECACRAKDWLSISLSFLFIVGPSQRLRDKANNNKKKIKK